MTRVLNQSDFFIVIPTKEEILELNDFLEKDNSWHEYCRFGTNKMGVICTFKNSTSYAYCKLTFLLLLANKENTLGYYPSTICKAFENSFKTHEDILYKNSFIDTNKNHKEHYGGMSDEKFRSTIKYLFQSLVSDRRTWVKGRG